MVDELVGQQQVGIKTLEENSDPVEGISGATILGDGKVSLILDIGRLQQMAKRTPPPSPDMGQKVPNQKNAKDKSVAEHCDAA